MNVGVRHAHPNLRLHNKGGIMKTIGLILAGVLLLSSCTGIRSVESEGRQVTVTHYDATPEMEIKQAAEYECHRIGYDHAKYKSVDGFWAITYFYCYDEGPIFNSNKYFQ